MNLAPSSAKVGAPTAMPSDNLAPCAEAHELRALRLQELLPRAICRWNPVIASSEKPQICTPCDCASSIAQRIDATFSGVLQCMVIWAIAMRCVMWGAGEP